MTEPPDTDSPGHRRWGSEPYEAFRAWASTTRVVGCIMDRVPEEHDLNADDVAFLFWLGEFDGVDPGELRHKDLPNQANLAKRSELSQSAVSERLRKLIRLGLVAGDRQSAGLSTNTILYTLTDDGRALLDVVSPTPP